ncbi:MAG TPA: peptidoglycan DD-metalloendopeptidase family protein [Thermoleophilaceae bacterium]|nr:peptidoglycan DD-metalloendopeptidase family protein [Thermoleophilaceae bacterium]
MRKYFWIPLVLAVAAYVLSPLPGESKPSLDKRIQGKRAQVQKAKAKEGVLTKDIVAYNNRISGLQGQISGTQKRLTVVQDDLDSARNELLEVRDKREVARDRLERTRAELKQARGGLEDRLVELYKADQPDALTVVLEADGFADLLERTDYLERISDQDGTVIRKVRVLKARAEKVERQLAGLERKRQVAAETILRRRDDIAAARDRLATAQGDLRSARNGRRTILASVRQDRRHAQEDLAAMEREQSKIRSQLAGGPGVSAGPIRKGSGNLIYPTNGSFTSPFGSRWGRLHAGIDIAAPVGTPIRAADSGRVAIAGMTGGYGNYTCIQHSGSMSTCYGHQSRIGVSVGQSVSQGQVIGAVGNTGNSTGPHLHFEVRIGGNPVDPMGYL